MTLCTSVPFLVYFVGKLKSVCLLRVRESSVLVFSCYDNLVFVRISAFSVNWVSKMRFIVFLIVCLCVSACAYGGPWRPEEVI